MGLTTFEKLIMNELRVVTGNRKLTGKNLMAWYTSKEHTERSMQAGEKLVHCPVNRVWCAVKE